MAKGLAPHPWHMSDRMRRRSSWRTATTTPWCPVDNARHFADKLRSVSTNPVVYAELPGAQHAFDLFPSLRFEMVVDAIEAFAAWVRSREVRSGHDPRLDH